MEVKGARILITGGAAGIGAALARRLAREGAAAIGIGDLNLAAAEHLAHELGKGGTRTFAARLDVGNEDQVQTFIESSEAELGPTDLMCSNAGIFTASAAVAVNKDWEDSWQVNVMSHVYFARKLIPLMLHRGKGYILMTCSAAGLLANQNAPHMVTEHAAVAFAEWLAIHYRSRGLNVSALCPLGVQTPMLARIMAEDRTAAAGVLAGGEPLTPEAVAEAVIAGLADERFLILPHDIVRERILKKATDRDQWIGSMEEQYSIVKGARSVFGKQASIVPA